MRRLRWTAFVLCLLVLPLLNGPSAGAVEVEKAWARASVGAAKNGAVYMTLVNDTDLQDRLLGVATDGAKKAGLHHSSMEEGVMKMRPLEAIEIAPQARVVLKPGGLHIMLMGLTAPLKQGDSLPLTLTFEEAGELEVMIRVQSITSLEADEGED